MTKRAESGGEALLDAVDELARFLEVHRPAEQIALDLVTAEIAHAGEIVRGLDAFGGDRHPEALGELDDRLDDRDRLAVAGRVADEAAVDLQFVEDGLVQIAERRIAGAEIVQRNADAERPKPLQHVERALAVAEEDRFGDLE